MEKLFDVHNFYVGTLISGSVLFLILLVFYFTLGEDFKIHFLIMMIIDVVMVAVVLMYLVC